MLDEVKSKKRGERLAKLETIKTNIRHRKSHMSKDDVSIGKQAQTGTLCSCNMCRNPRHSSYSSSAEKPTMQERRFFQEELMAVEEE